MRSSSGTEPSDAADPGMPRSGRRVPGMPSSPTRDSPGSFRSPAIIAPVQSAHTRHSAPAEASGCDSSQNRFWLRLFPESGNEHNQFEPPRLPREFSVTRCDRPLQRAPIAGTRLSRRLLVAIPPKTASGCVGSRIPGTSTTSSNRRDSPGSFRSPPVNGPLQRAHIPIPVCVKWLL